MGIYSQSEAWMQNAVYLYSWKSLRYRSPEAGTVYLCPHLAWSLLWSDARGHIDILPSCSACSIVSVHTTSRLVVKSSTGRYYIFCMTTLTSHLFLNFVWKRPFSLLLFLQGSGQIRSSCLQLLFHFWLGQPSSALVLSGFIFKPHCILICFFQQVVCLRTNPRDENSLSSVKEIWSVDALLDKGLISHIKSPQIVHFSENLLREHHHLHRTWGVFCGFFFFLVDWLFFSFFFFFCRQMMKSLVLFAISNADNSMRLSHNWINTISVKLYSSLSWVPTCMMLEFILIASGLSTLWETVGFILMTVVGAFQFMQPVVFPACSNPEETAILRHTLLSTYLHLENNANFV